MTANVRLYNSHAYWLGTSKNFGSSQPRASILKTDFDFNTVDQCYQLEYLPVVILAGVTVSIKRDENQLFDSICKRNTRASVELTN